MREEWRSVSTKCGGPFAGDHINTGITTTSGEFQMEELSVGN